MYKITFDFSFQSIFKALLEDAFCVMFPNGTFNHIGKYKNSKLLTSSVYCGKRCFTWPRDALPASAAAIPVCCGALQKQSTDRASFKANNCGSAKSVRKQSVIDWRDG